MNKVLRVSKLYVHVFEESHWDQNKYFCADSYHYVRRRRRRRRHTLLIPSGNYIKKEYKNCWQSCDIYLTSVLKHKLHLLFIAVTMDDRENKERRTIRKDRPLQLELGVIWVLI